MEANWIAILVAGLIPMIIGFVWYNPKVFGNAWMKSLGITEEDVQGGNMPVIFGLSYVFSLLLAFFLLFTISGLHSDGSFGTFKHGAFHGFFLGLGLVMPVFVTNALFERKATSNIVINVSYWLVVFALMGGLLDAWR